MSRNDWVFGLYVVDQRVDLPDGTTEVYLSTRDGRKTKLTVATREADVRCVKRGQEIHFGPAEQKEKQDA